MSKYPAEWQDPGNYMSSQEILDGILEGADWTEPEEGTQRTNGQMWAALLRMDETERMKWFDMVKDHAAAGSRCFLMHHDGLVEQLSQVRKLAVGYHAAAELQMHEAETYYARMRKALDIAHHWRNFARNLQSTLDGTAVPEEPLVSENDYPSCMVCGKDVLPGQAHVTWQTIDNDVAIRHGWCHS